MPTRSLLRLSSTPVTLAAPAVMVAPAVLVALVALLSTACTRSLSQTEASRPSPAESATPDASAAKSATPAAGKGASDDAGALTKTKTDAATPAEPVRAWPAALPKPTLSPAAPLNVVGYPSNLKTCLPDPAHYAGFTRDAEEFGYCSRGQSLICEFVDRSRNVRKLDATDNPDDGPAEDPAKARSIQAWIADAGVPALTRGDCTLRPVPITGNWAYPDITIHVLTVASTLKQGPSSSDPQVGGQPAIRLGGALAGEKPVFPITMTAPHMKLEPPATGEVPYNWTEVNGLALSPDGKELGIVTHSYCMEWCDDFEMRRIPTNEFASLVYNDVGFRAHAKKDFRRAVELFTRAAFVDPSRPLPAYNLACAYARLGDEHTKDALTMAIERGGEPIRERARKDADFSSVRTAPWFEALVGQAR